MYCLENTIKISRGEICVANFKALANGASLDRFLMANWAIYTNKVTEKQMKVGQC